MIPPSAMLAMSDPSVALLVLFLAIAHCFAGYILFRLNLLIDGLGLGAWLGVALVATMRQVPTDMDYFVGASVGAILLGILAWNVYRLVFSAGVAWAAYLVVSGLFGQPAATGGVVLGVIAAIGMGIYTYARTRALIMLLTSIIGAAAAVVCLSSMIAGQWTHPYSLLAQGPFFLIAAIAAAAILATAGYFSQKIGVGLFGKKFSPEGIGGKRKLAGDINLRVVK